MGGAFTFTIVKIVKNLKKSKKKGKNGLTNAKIGYILRTWSANQGDDRTKWQVSSVGRAGD